MTIPAVGNLYRVILNGHDSKSRFVNVRWYIVGAVSGTGPTAKQVGEEVNGAMYPKYLDLFATTVIADFTSAQLCNSGGIAIDDAEVDATGLPDTGNSAGDEMPSFVAGVISLRTGLAGKSFRGRLFTWPAGESANDIDGQPTAGWQIAAGLFATQLRTILLAGAGGNTATLVPAVYSKVQLAAFPIQSTIVRPEWGTIRHRKIGRGI